MRTNQVIPHFRYLLYVIRHKWFVFVAGRKTGAPLWRLIIHDWSKFTPAEWRPYVDNFYGPKLDEDWMGFMREARKARFNIAWLHHQHRNPHHWQHWVQILDRASLDANGAIRALDMPPDLVCEMVADWAGAGRAIKGKWEVADWYRENRHKMILSKRTEKEVEGIIAKVFL